MSEDPIRMKLRLKQRAGWGAVLALSLACSDSPAPTGPGGPPSPTAPTPFVISNPVESDTAGGQFTVVFVSLPPGAIPDAWAVAVRNPRAGSNAAARVSGGGFDPVRLAATEGDTLDFLVDGVGGVRHGPYRNVVASRSRPAVVRTSPAPNKADVPLNVRIVVTFSEPMDAASLPGAVTLLAGVLPVPGTVAADGEDGLQATFVPAELLAPRTSYRLRIGTGARDRQGDALAVATEIGFTTAGADAPLDPDDPPPDPGDPPLDPDDPPLDPDDPPPDPGDPPLDPDAPPIAGRLVFASRSDRQIYEINADGSARRRLTTEGRNYSPVPSPDGSRIAFARDYGNSFDSDIYLMDEDGSNVVRRTVGSISWQAGIATGLSLAVWSPDGRWLAVSSEGLYYSDIWLIRTDDDGTPPLRLVRDARSPAWSPDGQRHQRGRRV